MRNSYISPHIENIAPGYSAQLREALQNLDHGEENTYDQRQTAHLFTLVDLAKQPFPDGDHLRRVVGVLYITAPSFREHVHALLKARTLESPTIVARLDNSSNELTWLVDYPGFYENRGGDNHSESSHESSRDGLDPEQVVWVRLRTTMLRGYSTSHLAEKYPLSAVVRKNGDKVRVLRMKRKDAEDEKTKNMCFFATLIRDEIPDNNVVTKGGAYDDLVDFEERVEVQIMGDEYDDSHLKRTYKVSSIFKNKNREEPGHRRVFMKYKDAMDLMCDYNDKRDNAADSLPRATAGDMFQVDLSFYENTGTEPVINLTKDEVVLACLWAATQGALWSQSLDSDPLMRMVHGLSDVVLVS